MIYFLIGTLQVLGLFTTTEDTGFLFFIALVEGVVEAFVTVAYKELKGK